ncbi:MAG TPA: GAP family protein, partial [Gaiellaceae bacterium]|nr:GAP family protein [Gaiellaceae bacterium]
MPARLIALAVLAAVTSPTAIAAVLVILNRSHPVRLLSAYVSASFLTSVLVGIAVVAGLTATAVVAPSRRASEPILYIGIGVLILVSAAWLHSARSAALRRRST